MGARIDAVRGVVTTGDRSWPFEIEGRQGTVALHLGGGRVRLRSLSWRAKRVLARFAHLGEAFVRDQFVRSCLDAPAALPEDDAERDAMLALALWLSAPGGEPPLPLDQRVLAAVTVHTCRATHAAPSALDELDAADVELMWRAARGEADASSPEPSESTRILIVPDGGAPASGRSGLDPEPAAPAIPSGPAPTATAAGSAHAARVAGPASPSSAGPAFPIPVEPAGRSAPTPITAPASSGEGRRTVATSRSASRPPARFRVSLGALARAPAPTAVAPAGFAERRGVTMPAGVTSSDATAAPPRPWPVTAASSTAARAVGLDMADAHPAAVVGSRVAVASSSPAAPGTHGPAVAGSRPAAAAFDLVDDLFDELAVRLEQAAGELGIDVEARA